jgi:S1-C subfamily serine protease
VTNNHVVEGAKEVTVRLANKEEYTAKVIGRDPKTDIAS